MAIIAKNKQGKEIRWGDLIDSNDLSKGKYFPLHADQIKVFNQRTRFTAAIAGTGGGKTVCIDALQRSCLPAFNDSVKKNLINETNKNNDKRRTTDEFCRFN